MPRRSRLVLPNVPHHVTQRGNNRNRVFFDDCDRKYFLTKLNYYSRRNGLSIASYCLMDNHTHLIVIPDSKKSLEKTFKPLHLVYSQYLNKKFNKSGINWQGRFFSSPMDDSHTHIAFQYIALNPVKAKLVNKPAEYKWSSAYSHLGLSKDRLLTAAPKWLKMASKSVAEVANGAPIPNSLKTFIKIKKTLSANLPLGSEEFIEKLEQQEGRKLGITKVGRPKKTD